MTRFLEAWNGARSETSPGTYERRIDVGLPFYVTVTNPGGLPGLLLRVNERVDFEPSELRGTERFPIAVDHDGDTTVLHLATAWDDAIEVFLHMGEDIVPRVLATDDAATAAQTLVRRFNTWQRFLRHTSNGVLAESKRLGLFGELTTLADLMIPTLGPEAAVEAWTGPERLPHDFQTSRMAVEVKSIVHSEPQVLRIDGERQLDDFGLDVLLVSHHRVFRHRGSGTTLPELIATIRGELAPSTSALDCFDDKVFEYGYDDRHADSHYSTTGYSLQRTTHYRVRDGFPRLTEADLRPGMGSVRYSVAAGVCEPFEVDADTMASWMADPESIVDPNATLESREVEYKQTVWTPIAPTHNDEHRDRVSREIQTAVVKTIVAFMNADGGELLVGVDDDGTVTGVEVDLEGRGRDPGDIDGYELDLWTLLENQVDGLVHHQVRLSFDLLDDRTVCRVAVAPSPAPRFGRPRPKPNEKARPTFWVRAGNRTVELEGTDMVNYIQRHWP